MIGPLFALILGGAQGVPPVLESWGPAVTQLLPAKVLPADPAETAGRGPLPASSTDEDAGGEAQHAEAASDLMPFRLERAVVYPAP